MDKSKALMIMDIYLLIAFIILVTIYKGKIGREKNLINYCFGTFSVYILSRVTKKDKIMNIFHVLFALMMIFFAIFSKNKENLTFLVGLSLTITASRRLFDGCLVRKIEKKDNKLTSNSLTKMLNWDLIFPALGLIGLFKLDNAK